VHGKHGAVLSSPRSVEACKRQGILPEELLYRSKDQTAKVYAAEELDEKNLQIRFEHMEKRRQEKMRIVVEERLRLVEMEKAGLDIYGRGGGARASQKGGTTAGLLEREANMIAKMKKNQQKEVEQMLEYETKMQLIRQKNEEKCQKQVEKELKRKKEVEDHRREAEEKRLKYEEEKKQKVEEAEAERRRAEQEHFTKEKLTEEELRRKELARKKESKEKEEQLKKKQQQLKEETQKILERQKQEVLARKREMELKEGERKQKADEEKRLRHERAVAIQEEHERKINETKVKTEEMTKIRKKQYDEKEKVAQEKKLIFEKTKEELANRNAAVFKKKEEKIEKAKETTQTLLVQKKEEYFDKLKKNEEKKKLLEMTMKAEMERKREEELQLERKRQEILKNNVANLEDRKNKLLKGSEEKEQKIKSVNERKEEERKLRNNLEQIKKIEKLENVKRNERKKEYERQQLWAKILDENGKIDDLKSEKNKLMKEKMEVKIKIDKDKEILAQKFQLVKEGKLDPASLGVGSDTDHPTAAAVHRSSSQANQKMRNQPGQPKNLVRESSQPRVTFKEEKVSGDQSAPTGLPKQPIKGAKSVKDKEKGTGKFQVKEGENLAGASKRLKDVQGREILKVLEEESNEENKRETELSLVTDPMERKRLSKIHGVQKAKAKERINAIMKKHEDELEELKGKF
jgi:hypothetical protein